jgi:hypothetical protein
MPSRKSLTTFMLFHSNAIRRPVMEKARTREDVSEEEFEQYGSAIHAAMMSLPHALHDTFKFLLQKEHHGLGELWVRFVKSFEISQCYNATANQIVSVGSKVQTTGLNYCILTQHKLVNMPELAGLLVFFGTLELPPELATLTKEKLKGKQEADAIDECYARWKTGSPWGTLAGHHMPPQVIQRVHALLTHPTTKELVYTDDEILEALYWEFKMNEGCYAPLCIINKYGFEQSLQ